MFCFRMVLDLAHYSFIKLFTAFVHRVMSRMNSLINSISRLSTVTNLQFAFYCTINKLFLNCLISFTLIYKYFFHFEHWTISFFPITEGGPSQVYPRRPDAQRTVFLGSVNLSTSLMKELTPFPGWVRCP